MGASTVQHVPWLPLGKAQWGGGGCRLSAQGAVVEDGGVRKESGKGVKLVGISQEGGRLDDGC